LTNTTIEFIFKYSLFRCVSIGVTIAVIVYIVVDVVIEQPRTLISALGLFLIVSFMFFFSKDPSKVPTVYNTLYNPMLYHGVQIITAKLKSSKN